jgi:hypothetical protein
MIIGIDIDGTITKYPELFIELGRLIKTSGGRVYIITGLGSDGLAQRMSKYPWFQDKTWYDKIITTSFYNDEERKLIGKVQSNEEIVGRFKQRVCRELGVDIMFDDMASIHRNFGKVPVFEVK